MQYDKDDPRGTLEYRVAALRKALRVEARPRQRYNYGPAPKKPDMLRDMLDGFVKHLGETMARLKPVMGVKPAAQAPATVRKPTTRELAMAPALARIARGSRPDLIARAEREAAGRVP